MSAKPCHACRHGMLNLEEKQSTPISPTMVAECSTVFAQNHTSCSPQLCKHYKTRRNTKVDNFHRGGNRSRPSPQRQMIRRSDKKRTVREKCPSLLAWNSEKASDDRNRVHPNDGVLHQALFSRHWFFSLKKFLKMSSTCSTTARAVAAHRSVRRTIVGRVPVLLPNRRYGAKLRSLFILAPAEPSAIVLLL